MKTAVYQSGCSERPAKLPWEVRLPLAAEYNLRRTRGDSQGLPGIYRAREHPSSLLNLPRDGLVVLNASCRAGHCSPSVGAGLS